MFIVTDPSSPSGPPYVPILAIFELPTVGTGLKYPNTPWNPEKVPCEGCQTVWAEIVEEQDAFYDQVHHQEWIYAAELAIVILLLIGPLLLGGAATLLYHLRKYNPDVYPEKYYPPAQRARQPDVWKELFFPKASRGRKVAGTVPRNNMEDDQF